MAFTTVLKTVCLLAIAMSVQGRSPFLAEDLTPLQAGSGLSAITTGSRTDIGLTGVGAGSVSLNTGSVFSVPGTFSESFRTNGAQASFQNSNGFGSIRSASTGNGVSSVSAFTAPFIIDNAAIEQAALAAFRRAQGQLRSGSSATLVAREVASRFVSAVGPAFTTLQPTQFGFSEILSDFADELATAIEQALARGFIRVFRGTVNTRRVKTIAAEGTPQIQPAIVEAGRRMQRRELAPVLEETVQAPVGGVVSDMLQAASGTSFQAGSSGEGSTNVDVRSVGFTP